MMIRKLVALLIFILAPSQAFGQASEETAAEMQKKKAVAEFKPMTGDLSDMIYGFFTRTITNKKISSEFHDIYEKKVKENVENRRDYNFLLIGVKMEDAVTGESMKATSQAQVKRAAGEETLKMMPYVTEFARSLNLKFDLAAPFRTASAPSKNSKGGTIVAQNFAQNAGIMPLSAGSNKDLGEMQLDNEQAVAKEDEGYKWERLTRFTGSLSNSINDQSDLFANAQQPSVTGFSLVLKQEDGFYQFVRPLKNDPANPGKHQFKLPVHNEFSLGVETNIRGKSEVTTAQNILGDSKKPRFDVSYSHVEHAWATKYIIKKHKHTVEVGYTSAEVAFPYNVAYGFNF